MSLKSLSKFSLTEGDLKDTPFAAVLGLARFARATGELELRRDKIGKSIFFLSGIPIYCSSDIAAESLRQTLAKSGKINSNNVKEVEKLMEAEKVGEDFALLRLNIIDNVTRHRELQTLTLRRILTVFEWSAGRYRFEPGECFLDDIDIFDLDPLDLIHEGLSTYQANVVANDILEISNSSIESRGDLAALEGFLERYHPDANMNLFTRGPVWVADIISPLTRDMNRSLALLYELLVAGIVTLESHLIGDQAAQPQMTKTCADGSKPTSSQSKTTAQPTPPPRPANPLLPPEPPASFRKRTLKSYEEVTREEAERAKASEPQAKSRTPTPVSRPNMDLDLLRRFESMLAIIKKGDHFETLGVMVDTDRSEIKKAFFNKNQQFHRDRARSLGVPGEALAEQIHEGLTEAYETLIDADSRYAYEMARFKAEQNNASSIPAKKELAKKLSSHGHWYLGQKRPELAFDLFDWVVKLDMENYLNYAYLGWAQYASDKSRAPDARGYFKTSIEINENQTEAYFFLGWLEKDCGNFEAAKLWFEKAFKADPHNKWAKTELDRLQTDKPKTEGLFGKLFKK